MNWRYTAKWVPSGRLGYHFTWFFVPGFYRISIGTRSLYLSKDGGWHFGYCSPRWRGLM